MAFPGGKLEAGESLLDAARREMWEEPGTRVTSVGETLYACADPESVFVIDFAEVEIDGEPRAPEHGEVRWVTLAEARGMELAPADTSKVQQVSGCAGSDHADSGICNEDTKGRKRCRTKTWSATNDGPVSRATTWTDDDVSPRNPAGRG